MNLNTLYSQQRSGAGMQEPMPETAESRTEFQRDFDRIIFSSAFRRLQNKTQVFPLPGSVFVHNRLTHSLEVASVGRTLGSLSGNAIVNLYKNDLSKESAEFYRYDLYNVISSACLCHDIGNPAFGHSGEDAIASFFIRNESALSSYFTEDEWKDLICFEGNANSFRVLTQQQKGKTPGGLKLTFSTLSAIAKYPCESSARNKKILHRKKFGFFQSEKATFLEMASQTGMSVLQDSPVCYKRHPFVWLVEAADDICYNIIDFEDAHRLGIISHEVCESLLLSLVNNLNESSALRTENQLSSINDKNERITYLRAKTISILIQLVLDNYISKFNNVLSGDLDESLFESIKKQSSELQKIGKYSIENIYNHRNVVEIENAGYNVMYELFQHFVPPLLKDSDKRTQADKMALKLLPTAYFYEDGTSYEKVMGIVDYISGMTDNYATDLYRRIKGIEIGMKF